MVKSSSRGTLKDEAEERAERLEVVRQNTAAQILLKTKFMVRQNTVSRI